MKAPSPRCKALVVLLMLAVCASALRAQQEVENVDVSGEWTVVFENTATECPHPENVLGVTPISFTVTQTESGGFSGSFVTQFDTFSLSGHVEGNEIASLTVINGTRGSITERAKIYPALGYFSAPYLGASLEPDIENPNLLVECAVSGTLSVIFSQPDDSDEANCLQKALNDLVAEASFASFELARACETAKTRFIEIYEREQGTLAEERRQIGQEIKRAAGTLQKQRERIDRVFQRGLKCLEKEKSDFHSDLLSGYEQEKRQIDHLLIGLYERCIAEALLAIEDLDLEDCPDLDSQFPKGEEASAFPNGGVAEFMAVFQAASEQQRHDLYCSRLIVFEGENSVLQTFTVQQERNNDNLNLTYQGLTAANDDYFREADPIFFAVDALAAAEVEKPRLENRLQAIEEEIRSLEREVRSLDRDHSFWEKRKDSLVAFIAIKDRQISELDERIALEPSDRKKERLISRLQRYQDLRQSFIEQQTEVDESLVTISRRLGEIDIRLNHFLFEETVVNPFD